MMAGIAIVSCVEDREYMVMQEVLTASTDETILPLRERKKRKTRRLLVNTAIDLFTRRGFDEVTLEDIAAACDVSRGTVFNYFPYKELMILAFMDTFMASGVQDIRSSLASGEDPVSLLWRALDIPKEAARERPSFLCITASELLHYDQERANAAQHSLSYLPLVVEIVDAGQQAGKMRDDTPAADLALYLSEACLVSIARNCTTLRGDELDALITARQRVLMHGLVLDVAGEPEA